MSSTENHSPEGVPLFDMNMDVRWGDMDAMGHVNNSMYFRYFETVRVAWYDNLGRSALGHGEESFVIIDNHAEYLAPVVYPSHLHVQMAGHSPGRSSFVSTYTITVGGVMTTRGSSKIVWVNNREMKSTPLPGFITTLLNPQQN